MPVIQPYTAQTRFYSKTRKKFQGKNSSIFGKEGHPLKKSRKKNIPKLWALRCHPPLRVG
jgi:hypothetical protein